jgi:formylglycine-generating enzyme required for sulfatase activity
VSAPVGRFRPNPFGLYDVLGNVWEWTCSAYGGTEKDCASKSSSDRRVTRGGFWNARPRHVRSATRRGTTPGNRVNILGFRLARTP